MENTQVLLNIVWTMVGAFLVYFMQAGFAMVETGFTRAKNSGNILMKNMMDSAMGHKIQTGEYRKDPKEPAWICPPDYEYEIVEMPHFKMEYLRPTGVCTGRVILQLHGGGYIGPMKNIYRDFEIGRASCRERV